MTSLPDDFEASISHFLLPPLTSNTEEPTIQRSPSNSPAISEDHGYISPYRQPVPWAWAAIIIGQLVILGFGWVFFAVVYHYGPIPLPDAMATRAAASQRTVTLVVTLVATALSLVSAFLFKCAMRYALTARLARPISLFSFSNAVELSRGSLVLSLRHVHWTIGSLICVIALSTMTAGWVTLLAPTNISVMTPIIGDELDVESPSFNQLFNSDFFDPNPIFEPIIDMSGLASAGRSFGIPSIVNFNGGSYNISTGGILPVVLNTAEIHGYNTTGGLYGNDWQGGFIPSRTGVKRRYPQPSGFNSNYTVIQQGLTANVSCQAHANVSAVPSLEVLSQIIPSSSDLFPWNLTTSAWSTRCINGVSYGFTAVTYLNSANVVVGVLCLFMNMSSTADSGVDLFSHVFAFLGNGTYDFITPTVCTIIPKVTTVDVTYGSLINVDRKISTRNVPRIDSAGIGFASILAIQERIQATQNLNDSGFGDSLLSIYQSQPESNGTAQKKEGLMHALLEGYMTGIVEISASMIRASYSVNITLPSNMTTAVNGTLQSDTIGWDHGLDAGIFILLPMSFVALLCFIAIATSVNLAGPRSKSLRNGKFADGGDGDDVQDAISFDSSDPMHLVFATAAGNLRDVLGDLRESDVAKAEEIRVRLGYVNGEKMGLVTDSVC